MNSVDSRTVGARVRRLLPVLAAWCLIPAVAFAHPGVAPRPHDLWRSWSLEPAVLLGLALGAWSYGRGLRALWRRAGRGRGVAAWRAGSFAAGLAALALALVSPIDRTGSALFAVHMVQHLLLVMIAAPLIVLGEPLLVGLWAMPVGARRAIGRWWRHAEALREGWHYLSLPLVAWTLHVGALWLWHMPSLYDVAVRHTGVHALEHISFLLTAMLFWWVIVDRRARRRLGVGGGILFLFAAGLQSTLLGAALTFSRRPWYTAHWGTTSAWGLSPLEDQQLAGLLMWIPAGLIYLAPLVPLLVRALRTAPAREPVPEWAGA
jgi:putative membrane protein